MDLNEAGDAPSALSVCVRAGCNNPAVESKDWDKEYCSNECVATHCRCVCACVCVILVRSKYQNDVHSTISEPRYLIFCECYQPVIAILPLLVSLCVFRDIFMAWCSIKNQSMGTVK